MAETIQGVLFGSASIRAVATVVNVDATAYDVLVDRTETGAGWGVGTAAVTETSTR